MAKSLPEVEQLTRCSNELDVLDGMISYADKMIAARANDGSNYHALRRHAYGKAVVIHTQKKGQLVFRLTSASAIPNGASNCGTAHSPIGRLCAYLRPGDEDESPAWGEYQVLETRLFDRYDGLVFEDNIRNFLRMVVEGESGNATVTDLSRSLRHSRMTRQAPPASVPIVPAAPIKDEPTPQLSEPADQPTAHPTLQFLDIEVADEEESIGMLAPAIDDTDELSEIDRPAATEYYGLSEVFYVNRTREQDQVIARSPIGAMFVEGVAGSGKTSAALGRTKMLCDFNETSVVEEAAFREIAGQSLAHWSGKFAGKFSQEGCIGFVRTGELIQYLKETCRRIDLPHLPVAEFKELQVRLRKHRKVERSRIPGWRWSMQTTRRESEAETTMAWLRAADRAVSSTVADRWATAVPIAATMTDLFVPTHRITIEKVVTVALKAVQAGIKPLQTVMLQSPSVGRFGLDKLAGNLIGVIRDIRSKILSKDVLWLLDVDQPLYAANESGLASLLMRRKVPLYLRSAQRLVVLDDEQVPIDSSLTFLTEAGEPIEWSKEVHALLLAGKVAVKDAGGLTLRAVASNAMDLSLKLLPEAIEKLYVLRGGRLRPLVLHRGLGRYKFELLKPAIEEPDEEEAENLEKIEAVEPAPSVADPKFKTIDALLEQQLQKVLLQPLAYLADTYMESLATMEDTFPVPALARQIYTQMQGKKLTDEDIDLLLCLSHLVGRGFDGKPFELRAPSYYQSVFIDEVQDFTEQQVYLMAEQTKPEYKSITVVGDIAQKLHHGSQIDIRACFPGVAVAHVTLTENLRQLEAPGLAWFSTCFRAELQGALATAHPSGELLQRLIENVHNVKGPELNYFSDVCEMDELIVDLLRKIPAGQTAAVILPNSDLAAELHTRLRPTLNRAPFVDSELSDKVDLSRRHVRHFTSVLSAKGLEFDVVILPLLEAYDLEDRSHINRLYVGLTRARKRLVLLAATEMISARFDAVWSRYEDAISQL